MAEQEHSTKTQDAHVERSTEELSQDIAKRRENLSQTVEQMGERVKEKLDWREYVKDSPYLALGAATGIGYLASRVFIKRPTPMERIIGSIAGEVRHSVGGLLVGAAGLNLIKVTLLHIATEVAAGWIKNASSAPLDSGRVCPPPKEPGGSNFGPGRDV